MKVLIKKSKINGVITAPSSKSEFHRALFCATQVSGKSIIKYGSINDDVKQTVNALRKLGVRIKIDKYSLSVDGTSLFRNIPKHIDINCADSGTTVRFLIAL